MIRTLIYQKPEIKITGSSLTIHINDDYFVLPELDKISSIMLITKAGYISIYALKLLASKGISLTLHDLNGNIIYHFIPEKTNKNFKNRIIQYKAFFEKRKNIANKIIEIKKMKYNELLKKYDKPMLIENTEGLFSNEYFSYFSALLKEYGYEYTFRYGILRNSNQRAINRINTLMNLYYGYIEHCLLITSYEYGLDYNIAYLHEPQYNKIPITYDLIELLRADIDNIVLQLAKKRKIILSDFILNENYYIMKEEKIPVYIKQLKPVIDKTEQTVKDLISIINE